MRSICRWLPLHWHCLLLLRQARMVLLLLPAIWRHPLALLMRQWL